jgi:hypothetical protein
MTVYNGKSAIYPENKTKLKILRPYSEDLEVFTNLIKSALKKSKQIKA